MLFEIIKIDNYYRYIYTQKNPEINRFFFLETFLVYYTRT